MKIVAKRFLDSWRGNGYILTLHFSNGWLCFAFRPMHWHLYYAKLQMRPARRFYIGPFEIELMRIKDSCR